VNANSITIHTLQIHINADIALATEQLWLATRDLGWLSSVGAPIAFATSRYWAERVVECSCGGSATNGSAAAGDEGVNTSTTRNERGCFCIQGVMGADELYFPVRTLAEVQYE
jgi:hypothetical protein